MFQRPYYTLIYIVLLAAIGWLLNRWFLLDEPWLVVDCPVIELGSVLPGQTSSIEFCVRNLSPRTRRIVGVEFC